ncbi:MAG: metallophosphoesterase family protein [Lentimicrobiaceae bacterium]|jgi:hypothetical protein|nr:metallophosphoesterase family protein [Lentimicrobiaceae bacterium]MCP4909905.1 metallophosphoesterase family protein [Bacteroidota bacterium]MBT3453690.1 metallophosphoesterase family protein [Lentimicrobiaceae bacterium]MBT3818225.1 metallophosphoesterase family protein [Lentimicrobiaceae bacterium]MBT4061771.1 metallophosphoesterase family protein [Lentimicrobiaceae bacterium]
MKRIGLLSDTHGHIHPRATDFFSDCHEIWHAGDIGNIETLELLKDIKPTRAVYGNIDGADLRSELSEFEIFTIEGIKVLIIHIGGYPGRYEKQVKYLLDKHNPGLFISGHSHILKVMPDKNKNLLHINPGAAGNIGLHKVITLLKFIIRNGVIEEVEIFEAER